MILPLLLSLQSTAPVPQDVQGDDIVVIGERLKEWRGKFRVRNGRVTCKTVKSTGDRAVDAIGCDAMVACLAPVSPQFEAVANTVIDPRERDQKLNALLETLHGCLTETRRAGIESLVARRRAK